MNLLHNHFTQPICVVRHSLYPLSTLDNIETLEIAGFETSQSEIKFHKHREEPVETE